MLPVFMSMSNPSRIGARLSGTRIVGYSNASTKVLSSIKGATGFIAMSSTSMLLNLIIQFVACVQRLSRWWLLMRFKSKFVIKNCTVVSSISVMLSPPVRLILGNGSTPSKKPHRWIVICIGSKVLTLMVSLKFSVTVLFTKLNNTNCAR